jgi:hypothetical protein
MDASVFDVCQPHEWEKAHKKKFGDLIAEYEVLFNRWTMSGFHGDFDTIMDEAIAHSEDNTNPAMLYLHKYLAGFNNHKLLNICMGFLPSDTFCESASGPPCCQSRDTTNSRSSARGDYGGSSRSGRVACGGDRCTARVRNSKQGGAQENAIFAPMSEKNHITSHKSAAELNLATIRDLQGQPDRKRALTTELANHIGGGHARKEAREKIARFKMASDDDGDDSYVKSQETLAGMIVEWDTFISEYESNHRKQKKLLKSFFLW